MVPRSRRAAKRHLRGAGHRIRARVELVSHKTPIEGKVAEPKKLAAFA